MQSTDCEGSDALLVGAQGLGDGAHGSAVVSVCHKTQALLRLGKLSQAVQPEVEVLRCHAGSQTLVQLAGEFVAPLQMHHNMFHPPVVTEQSIHNRTSIVLPQLNFKLNVVLPNIVLHNGNSLVD